MIGTGDGNPDFYSFEVTQDMLSQSAGDIQVRFDIDHGYELGDRVFWVSALKLYKLTAPLDPSQPTLPTLIAESSFFNFDLTRARAGSTTPPCRRPRDPAATTSR